jgi:hypothetical protein
MAKFSVHLQKKLEENGVVAQYSVSYEPQQNDVAKR